MKKKLIKVLWIFEHMRVLLVYYNKCKFYFLLWMANPLQILFSILNFYLLMIFRYCLSVDWFCVTLPSILQWLGREWAIASALIPFRKKIVYCIKNYLLYFTGWLVEKYNCFNLLFGKFLVLARTKINDVGKIK